MFRGARHRRSAWRHVFVALTFLALLMRVAVPQGMMIAQAGSGDGFPLVICTGHGPLVAHTPAEKGDHKTTRSDAPCAFAGHAATSVPTQSAPIIGSAAFHTADVSLPAFDPFPGRGLAAPPPPSQGPPLIL